MIDHHNQFIKHDNTFQTDYTHTISKYVVTTTFCQRSY